MTQEKMERSITVEELEEKYGKREMTWKEMEENYRLMTSESYETIAEFFEAEHREGYDEEFDDKYETVADFFKAEHPDSYEMEVSEFAQYCGIVLADEETDRHGWNRQEDCHGAIFNPPHSQCGAELAGITDAYEAIESFKVRNPESFEELAQKELKGGFLTKEEHMKAVVNFARVLADIDADELALAEEEADELAAM